MLSLLLHPKNENIYLIWARVRRAIEERKTLSSSPKLGHDTYHRHNTLDRKNSIRLSEYMQWIRFANANDEYGVAVKYLERVSNWIDNDWRGVVCVRSSVCGMRIVHWTVPLAQQNGTMSHKSPEIIISYGASTSAPSVKPSRTNCSIKRYQSLG